MTQQTLFYELDDYINLILLALLGFTKWYRYGYNDRFIVKQFNGFVFWIFTYKIGCHEKQLQTTEYITQNTFAKCEGNSNE